MPGCGGLVWQEPKLAALCVVKLNSCGLAGGNAVHATLRGNNGCTAADCMLLALPVPAGSCRPVEL